MSPKKGKQGNECSHSDHISQCVILLIDGKDGCMRDFRIFFNRNPVMQRKEMR